MEKKCPFHDIEIPEDREIIEVDSKKFDWKVDPKGYFLVKIEHGMLCCGFVNADHKMVLEIRGKNPDKICKEIAKRELCSLGNMSYIAQELLLAKECLENNQKYVQR